MHPHRFLALELLMRNESIVTSLDSSVLRMRILSRMSVPFSSFSGHMRSSGGTSELSPAVGLDTRLSDPGAWRYTSGRALALISRQIQHPVLFSDLRSPEESAGRVEVAHDDRNLILCGIPYFQLARQLEGP